jgi:hypothetical protein
VVVHKFPSSLRRHYEQMARFPDDFLVLGDGLCSFNPVYGHGMTVSALEAQALDQCLRERKPRRSVPQRFFKQAARVIHVPWMLAAGEDFRYPEVEGPKAPGTDLINCYVAKVHQAATRNPEVHRVFLNVMHLMEPAAVLFYPRMMFRALKVSSNIRRAPAYG